MPEVNDELLPPPVCKYCGQPKAIHSEFTMSCPIVPRYQPKHTDPAAEITRLNQEIDALHAQIDHLKAGGNDVQKYTRMGKQILTEDGEHFADGASEYAAAVALSALNSAD
jgi:hypothetical protein